MYGVRGGERASIPHVFFVGLDAVQAEQLPNLVLEALAVMNLDGYTSLPTELLRARAAPILRQARHIAQTPVDFTGHSHGRMALRHRRVYTPIPSKDGRPRSVRRCPPSVVVAAQKFFPQRRSSPCRVRSRCESPTAPTPHQRSYR